MNAEKSVVGVVTVTYNSAGVLDDFLRSLQGQRGVTLRLYVIDNASADDSVDRIRDWATIVPVVIVTNSENRGVAEANNQGIELALQDSCDWVLLLNNDTVFTEDTIADLVAEAEHNNLSMVSPLIAATEPAATIWYSGGTVDPWRGMRVDHERKGASLDRFPRTLESTPYAPTCCLLIRPSVFGDIGLMDTIYFVYHDDVDFALRAGRAGHRIWVTPNAHLLHKASSLTGGELSDFSVTWSSRNWVLLARIHCTRLQLMYFSIHLHVWALARLLLRRDTVAIYLRRQRAFFDGWRVSLRDHVRYGIRSATRPVEQ